jgi:predicted flavoprotein YhiN
LLAERNIAIAPLQAANCGFIVAWSDYFREHFAAKPLKSVTLSFSDAAGQLQQKNGELMM